jgi:hypothetical protein
MATATARRQRQRREGNCNGATATATARRQRRRCDGNGNGATATATLDWDSGFQMPFGLPQRCLKAEDHSYGGYGLDLEAKIRGAGNQSVEQQVLGSKVLTQNIH